MGAGHVGSEWDLGRPLGKGWELFALTVVRSILRESWELCLFLRSFWEPQTLMLQAEVSTVCFSGLLMVASLIFPGTFHDFHSSFPSSVPEWPNSSFITIKHTFHTTYLDSFTEGGSPQVGYATLWKQPLSKKVCFLVLIARMQDLFNI